MSNSISDPVNCNGKCIENKLDKRSRSLLLISCTKQLTDWNKNRQLGVCTESKNFRLPNQSIKFASLAWISSQRLVTATLQEMERYCLCPNFILELKSDDDDIITAKGKMNEWFEHGCQLVWLIDKKQEAIYIFTKTKIRKRSGFIKKLSGEPVLPGFELDLSSLPPMAEQA